MLKAPPHGEGSRRDVSLKAIVPDFLKDESYRQRLLVRKYRRVAIFILLYCLGIGWLMKVGLATSIEFAVGFGTPALLGFLGVIWLREQLRRVPFMLAVLVMAFAYTALLTGLLLDMAAIMPWHAGRPSESILAWSVTRAWWLYPSFYLFVLATLAARGVSRKIGPGVFLNWVRGYYHRPRHEERIFMFLDMRDSTTLAERLGDDKFSALLRDFMYDLSDAVAATRGEVSHYIGDEAVLTWLPDRGFPEARCVQCFYRFQAHLERRRAHYESQYGFLPGFKAGIHFGNVVATEVGDLKSEIVYLGDVLNTTARIQGSCNAFDAELLLSEQAVARLPSAAWLRLTEVGAAELKGKAEPVRLVKAELNLAPAV